MGKVRTFDFIEHVIVVAFECPRGAECLFPLRSKAVLEKLEVGVTMGLSYVGPIVVNAFRHCFVLKKSIIFRVSGCG